MSEQILQSILDESIESFRGYKKLAESAFEQVRDEEFFKVVDAESNSIAAIVKHLGGNLRSRWTDFLTADGEKADRNRDAEFVADGDTRDDLTEIWNDGWRILFASLESLTVADFDKTVRIRGEEFSVYKAVTRAATHAAYHVGQIVFLAKHLRSENWRTLSVPKNKSAEFNAYLAEKEDKGNYLDAPREFGDGNLK